MNKLLLTMLLSVILTTNSFADEILFDERDGQSYKTVKIGNQVWMAENLNIGTIISSTQAGYQMSDNDVIERFCWENEVGNCDGENGVMKRGGFYEWKEAIQFWDGQPTLPVQGICPPNWHIPSLEEWNILFNNYSSKADAAKALLFDGDSGFAALLTGYRCTMTGGFRASAMTDEFKTYFVVANEVDAENIPVLEFATNNISIPFSYSKSLGFCVRCILDDPASYVDEDDFASIFSFSINPNPISESAILNYSIHSNIQVQLELFIIDISGNRVIDIQNKLLSQGDYSIKVDTSSLTSGKYFIIATINDNVYKLPIIIEK